MLPPGWLAYLHRIAADGEIRLESSWVATSAATTITIFFAAGGVLHLNWPDSTLTSERCHRLLHQAADYGAFNFQPFPLPAHLNANCCGSAV
jgi:hypothetical protein